ncbi:MULTISPECIES: DUF4432 family protein [unclassified Nocardioides]|uniref:DUF4432 family protein n=1 Tax=unclassified Nocardioides TaxID=2615069 RepID=UPI0006FFAD51|nr:MULTISPECIES: DUF4432 family protein [unclassified Nocardioides]KRA37676.1 hypothetical protein ASD81_02955 [Nocardioides sp. Root614]KRA91636.1 hypothetical protein ASD84_03220 [Nocardioides sp. Root682]
MPLDDLITLDLITLADDDLEVVVDVGRGADILSLTHRRTAVDVLFSTPWRERADAIRAGRARPSSYDEVAVFLEQYRGGWNTLCPNAGPPRAVAGTPVGFHGEAATARWDVVARTDTELRLRLSLFSVPVSIERRMVLTGDGTLLIEDDVTNDGPDPLVIDHVSHPAFGGAFLDGRCTVETNARHYTADPETAGSFVEPGTEHAWPWATGDGHRVDLREVPPPGTERMAFGWLSGFGDPWAAITNHDLGLTVRIAWDATHQPYAWFWQELNATQGFPWHRQARAFAIEPSSTITSGPDRASVLSLDPGQTVDIPLTMTLFETKDRA